MLYDIILVSKKSVGKYYPKSINKLKINLTQEKSVNLNKCNKDKKN